MRTRWTRTRSVRLRLAFSAAALAALAVAMAATASHPVTTLAGSNFEIDVDANLKVDDTGDDWASVTEDRKGDAPTGRDDDSYSGGSKEDDPCPGTTTGSIPNNKSDLLSFGVYFEPDSPGFLNLFWTRVQEPSGTTLMDFELNRSSEPCAPGRPNPVRTEGDLLIEYRIEQGGATAQVKVRTWTGSAWGPAADLTSTGDATGTINSSPIPVLESDGLATTDPLSPRTFGEAQLDLSSVLGADECTGFSTAFLKSRSSDSFTSQLKDFIGPESISVNNCGALLIEKTRKHAADGAGDHPHEGVDFTIDGGDLEDPISVTTDANGEACVGGLTAGDYTVTEDVPAGYASDDATKEATIAGQATCGSGDEETVTFQNTPLTDVDVSVDSQVAGGTSSTIDCDAAADPPFDAGPGGDISHSMDDLEPGTYTCTIVVDP